MPIYEYICSDCKCKFEELRPQSRAEEDAPCPRCHKPAKRKMSAFRANFVKSIGDYTAMAEAMAKDNAGSGGGCASCGGGSCSTCGG
ncbi:MAG: zinc ribbon domain-containing protein [Dehalococcoidales bacterium]|nr:zinc ribbon domain-containing protein [Dehalococcoidales bacterium]